ncbi:MAG: glycosyltransferase [Clostridium sp.]|nr:glycosyltransferase [Clostridium sp.]
MRILQINVVANWGSTGRIAEDIGRLCLQKGWESHIAYGRYMNPSQSRLITIGNKADVYIHAVYSLLGRHGLGSKHATYRLITEIERLQPDIIHLHNIHGYYLNYPILFEYLSRTDTPVLWTLHDCWPMTGQCAYFDSVHCDKWTARCHDCPALGKYPRALFDRSASNYQLKNKWFTALGNRLTLIPVSRWLEHVIQRSFLQNIPTHTIHNGIDTDIFRPVSSDNICKKLHVEGKFILLGLSSIWEERKGLPDLIQLNRLIDHSTEQIILVGLTDKQIRQLPPDIIGLRRTDSLNELVELYSAAGIYLNPTYEDNFPTTNLEALACGTPVCTYRTGGSPEAIDQETGFVVEQGDIEGMREAVLTVKRKGKTSYQTSCRTRAVNRFRAKDCFEKYIRLYERLYAEQPI